MASHWTIGQLRERLKLLGNADHDPVDLLNEVGEAAYAIGRWPNSTTEFEVQAADIYQNTDSGGSYENEWFLDIDAETYDGVIRFRVNGYGYPVLPRTMLFQEVPTGFRGFIEQDLLDESAGERRQYKCPSGVNNTDTIRVLVKKRWIDKRSDGDEFPIRSLAAIKAGFQAASYEADNNVDASEAKWRRFEQILLRDEMQYHGPKQARVQLRGSFRNKPSNFL